MLAIDLSGLWLAFGLVLASLLLFWSLRGVLWGLGAWYLRQEDAREQVRRQKRLDVARAQWESRLKF